MIDFSDVPPSCLSQQVPAQPFDFTAPPMPPALAAAAADKELAAQGGQGEKLAAALAETPPGAGAGLPPALAEAARKLGNAAGDFPLDDPVRLAEELLASVQSFNEHAYPHLAPLVPAKSDPITKVAALARAKKALGEADYAALVAGDPPPTSAPPAPPAAAAALASPAAAKAAALGKTAGLAEALGIPLAEAGAPAALQQMLQSLAAVPVPSAAATPAQILKMAAMLEQMAAIEDAFGPDALTLPGLRAIAEDHRKLMALGPPPGPPPLAALATAKAAPAPEDVAAGAKAAEAMSPQQAQSLAGVKPPKIPAQPMMEALAALRAALDTAIAAGPAA